MNIEYYGKEGWAKKLEEQFSGLCGTKYSLAVSSGTAALHSAFFGCGIGPGDEVLAPSYTFLATATPIFHCNVIPILCDVDYSTGNISIETVRERLTDATKAIVVTHLWGTP